jgi:hypothetical protein
MTSTKTFLDKIKKTIQKWDKKHKDEYAKKLHGSVLSTIDKVYEKKSLRSTIPTYRKGDINDAIDEINCYLSEIGSYNYQRYLDLETKDLTNPFNRESESDSEDEEELDWEWLEEWTMRTEDEEMLDHYNSHKHVIKRLNRILIKL